MPEKATLARARKDKRAGKAPSTQAGNFVREEIHHVREGKHGARSAKQAIAIGLSKARRAGVKLPARGGRSRPGAAARKASGPKRASPRRARASERALEREPRSSASSRALSRQARSAAQRSPRAGGRKRASGGRKPSRGRKT